MSTPLLDSVLFVDEVRDMAGNEASEMMLFRDVAGTWMLDGFFLAPKTYN